MTSLGFSEYAETSNNNNNEPKSNIRRNGGVGVGVGGRQNRTLKIPRSQETGSTNIGTSNNGFSATTAGKKIKQIKDYIENIHRKGGEDSEEDPDDSSLLPAYPAQGMGIYASNVSHSGIIRGADTVSSNTSPVVRKTTQMNSLNPGSSYSSTLLEGMESSAPTMSNIESPYFEKLTGISGAPKKDAIAAGANKTTTAPFSTNAYATHYYEQFVPYAETLANQLASGGSGGGGSGVSGTNAALIEKLNYIIHMLEEKKDDKTGHVIEELVLYCFLGIFIIFVVDTFTHAAGGNSGVGVGGRGGSMFGGMMRRGAATQYYRR
jgi:hypothetical protein